MHPIRACAALVSALVLGACDVNEGETRTLEIAPYLIPCHGLIPMSCMTGSERFPAGEGIKGFEFRWGHLQRITIETTRIEDPPEDAPSRRHVLVKVESSRAMPGWSFRTDPQSSRAYEMRHDTLAIVNYPEIRIPAASDREILAAPPGGGYVTVRVRSEDGSGNRLIGDSVRVVAASGY